MRRAAVLLLVLLAGCASGDRPPSTDPGPRYEGKPLSHWLRMLKDLSPERKAEAAAALRYFGPAAAPAIPDLVDALRFSYSERDARETLKSIGPASHPAVINAMTSSSSRKIREAASFVVACLVEEEGLRSPEVLAAIGHGLDDLEGAAAWAASAVKYLGADAAPFLPKLEVLAQGKGSPAEYAQESLKELKGDK